jgi:hypothetical protein
MRPTATSVHQYLDQLPPDRRLEVEAVRRVILDNLRGGYEEGMQYGMISYFVPHRLFPAGYHCDPTQPLPFACLGNNKAAISLHLMCVYGDTKLATWFREAWAKTGKKLDMGKACVRFKRADQLALDVIADAIRRVPVEAYVRRCEGTVAARTSGSTGKAQRTRRTKPPVSPRTPAVASRHRKRVAIRKRN